MSESYITAAMADATGRSYGRLVSFPVTESDIRRWAMAVYFPSTPPLEFWDAGAAAATRHGGIVAPHEFNPFAWMTAEPPGPRPPVDQNAIDANEIALGIAPPPLANGLNGGIEVQYFHRIRPGDVITSLTTLLSYSEKESRMGRMLVTRLEQRWTNQDGDTVKTLGSTLLRY